MTWQTFLFIIVAGAAFGRAGFHLRKLYRLMVAAQGKVPPFHRIADRAMTALFNVFGQAAVMQKNPIGIAHAIIFWGFIVISIGTLEQFLGTLYQPLNFEFLGPLPYSILLFVQDTFTFLILFAVGYAFYRRLVLRPEGIGKSSDANWILVFTGSLMVSILLMNAFHILGQNPWYENSLPFSKMLAEFISPLQLTENSASNFSTFFKWIHMLIVLGFAVYIPGSKHLHILAAGPNTFLRNLDRPKPMKPINFEDESIEQYGAAKVTDLSWKDLLDTYACTECGRCQDVCPAHNTQKPLSPKHLIMDIKENLLRNEEAIFSGQPDTITPLIDENITNDVIWACTSCRACEIACPVFINHVDKIYESRRNLVMMEANFPAEVQTVFKNMETNATPWAFGADDRANWAEGLNVKTVHEDPQYDVLLWVGCAGSFDDRNKKVLRAFVNILKKAEVKFAILGKEEQCTGDPARRIGNEYLYQTLATANIETLNRHQVKRIVTACPHCFNTLKNEYKDFGGHYEVFHHSEFIAQLISEGKIKPTISTDDTITFHDSCYLGRWNNIYDAPRDIIESIPGSRLTEMPNHHDKSMCCGAGGGRMWMEETIGSRINVTRTEEALSTKSGVIASSCPFCMTMLSDGIKSKDMSDKVRVVDIAELVNEATV